MNRRPRRAARGAVPSAGAAPAALRAASWIWPDNPWWDLYNCFAQLRKTFVLDRVPRSAPAYVTADQSYRLWVNGRPVCRGPARGFQASWPYDAVDLAPWLREGGNLVAIRAYNPGVGSYQYRSEGTAGVLFALQAGKVRVVSDTTWKARREDGIQRDAVAVSIQLFPQEIVDARREGAGWTLPGFDDASWCAPLVAAGFGGMPWSSMEERGIPLLREETVRPRALLGVAEGTCAEGWERTRDVAMLRRRESLEHRPVAAPGPPTVPRVLAVAPTGAGRYRSFLLDFGTTVVGSLELAVSGAAGGEIVDALYTESIEEARLEPHLLRDPYCRMAFASRLVCRPGVTRHPFHHAYGFRYLALTVRGTGVPVSVEVALASIGYPLERAGSFRGSDPVLDGIWETCVRTQQCCSLDAYVDTPWREQAQWAGDARVQAWNTIHLSGDARLARRGVRIVAGQTAPDGLTYGHAPTVAHNCILPDFTLTWMLSIWDLYWQTGSIEAYRAHAGVLDRALGYFAAHTDRSTGLLAYDPGHWLFLDWTGTYDGKAWTGTLFKEGFSSVYNLWYLLALEKVAGLRRLARDSTRAAVALERAREIRRALARFVDRRTGLVTDGMRTDGTPVASTSVHAQVLALMTGLAGTDETAMLERVLLPCIRGEPSPHVKPSAFWSTHLFTVLGERGHGAEVVAHIRERWQPMTAHGTTFEIFDPFPGDSSRSHAWSAHPLFHLMQIVGGIRQAAPAWRRIDFAPTFVGDEAEVTVPTPHGPIVSTWRRGDDGVSVGLAVPRGVTARVRLPGRKAERVEGRRRWTIGGVPDAAAAAAAPARGEGAHRG